MPRSRFSQAICILVCACVCVYMYLYVCVCTCVCVYICMCVCVHVYVYVCKKNHKTLPYKSIIYFAVDYLFWLRVLSTLSLLDINK